MHACARNVHTYKHACMHAYIHAYMHACIPCYKHKEHMHHSYIRIYVHTYAYMHIIQIIHTDHTDTYILTYIHMHEPSTHVNPREPQSCISLPNIRTNIHAIRFDFFLVLVGISGILIDALGSVIGFKPSMLRLQRVFRILRILRALRALKKAKGLYTIASTLVSQGTRVRH